MARLTRPDGSGAVRRSARPSRGQRPRHGLECAAAGKEARPRISGAGPSARRLIQSSH